MPRIKPSLPPLARKPDIPMYVPPHRTHFQTENVFNCIIELYTGGGLNKSLAWHTSRGASAMKLSGMLLHPLMGYLKIILHPFDCWLFCENFHCDSELAFFMNNQ